MMHKQNYSLCCKNTCCKQDNSRCKHFVGCQNYTKDSRFRTCVTGPPKGFVQNLKDKLVNLQNESLQLQFVKKPVKKKQKDYYCLMLRKINNLDKKLQKLENLFISHLNHTPNEVFNSSDNNEPLCDYMDFYESVRSLVDVANRLKEDILYKQSNNHMPNRNTLYINDRIQVLDSELQHLYTYLDQLQNCASEIKDAKQFFVQEDYQDLPYSYCTDDRRYSNFKGLQNSYKNKRRKSKKHNEDSYRVNHSSPRCVECYEVDEEFPISCQCSRCNVQASIFSPGPANKIYSPKRFENCQGPIAKKSDCSCEYCVNERKKMVFMKKNNLWVSQSISSCSCEICVGLNNKKYYDKNCNSARIKIIKPVKKGGNEENLLSELQISYHEMGPTKSRSDKNKQDNKRGKLNRSEEDKEADLGTLYYQDIGPVSKGLNSATASNIKSGDSVILEKNQEAIPKTRYSKTIYASNIQDPAEKNVVYYELTPDLNIITKRKNRPNINFLNSAQDPNQLRNKNIKKNKNKASSTNDMTKKNTFRFQTSNFYLREEDHSGTFPKKVVKNKIKSRNYHVTDKLSSENEHTINFYQADSSDKKSPGKPNNRSENEGPSGKHLHITFCKKRESEECMTSKKIEKGSPKHEYKYTNNHSQLRHRNHGGFCHFQNSKDDKKKCDYKRFPHFYSCRAAICESDSFETVEENESDCNSSSSQYKLFFCNNPNCVEKLNSDELIMLMNNTDLKSCGENLYQLNISENVKDLKSDVCEKCTIKEKTISVTPKKTKHKNANDEAEVIIKKEIVECFNCKNKNSPNDTFSGTTTINGSFNKDKDIKDLGSIKNKSSIINESERNINYISYKNIASYSGRNIGENNNNKDIKSQKKNSFSTKKESDLLSSTDEYYNNKKTNSRNIENKGLINNNSLIVAHSKLDINKSYTILKENENSSSKALELQRFGNTININIERGSYSLNQQPGIISIQESMDEKLIFKTDYLKCLENKNMNLGSIAGKTDDKIENKISTANNSLFLKDVTKEFSSDANNATTNISKNISNQPKTETIYSRVNKSTSALDLTKKSEKEIMSVKSAVFTMSVSNDNYGSKTKNGMKSQSKNNNEVPMNAAPGNSGMVDEKGGKIQSKKDITNMKKKSLNFNSEKNSVLLDTKNSHYTYEMGHNIKSKTQSASKKTIAKPRGSMTRLKRSRLKFSKHFGSSLSKVSSEHSVALHQAKLCQDYDIPLKKPSVFNPGRRISKLSKRRHNVYPRILSMKENCLSGIIKPQVKILVQESCNDQFKILTNSSNSRYKVASISNYLSSTVESESSYSTLNWGKVANKLKKDDNYEYYNDIA